MTGLSGWYGGGAPRGHIPPFTYIDTVTLDGTTTTATGPSVPLGPDAIEGFSLQNEWNTGGGTLAATIKIEASNDPRAFPGHPDYADAVWIDLTAAVSPTDPTTGAGTAMEMVSDVRFEYLRMTVTRSSGTGTFKSTFSGHGT